ncbi:hypothetical protein CRENBAI_005535 [Crenichthys baileyi]|uniref:Uncharacterized protein n=1 Tax=Crenichthys baileyi TaxID=28760 RepID=A0AAV9QUF9_9TELE
MNPGFLNYYSLQPPVAVHRFISITLILVQKTPVPHASPSQKPLLLQGLLVFFEYFCSKHKVPAKQCACSSAVILFQQMLLLQTVLVILWGQLFLNYGHPNAFVVISSFLNHASLCYTFLNSL